MKKAIAIIVSILFVFAVTSVSFAADQKAAPAPVEKKVEEKKAPVKEKKAFGEVAAIDTKANTITVKGKKSDTAVTCDDKTKVMMGKEKKACPDVKVGDKVKVSYILGTDGKNTAKSIKIEPAKPVQKKAEPAKPAGKK